MLSAGSIWFLLVVATLSAAYGVVAGVFFAESRKRVRIAVPLSSALLLAVVLFGLLPELAEHISWWLSLLLFAAGFGLLTLLDRAGFAICPDCAHEHGHHQCAAPLHGFATPLLVAAVVHSLFDGWAIAATRFSSTGVRYSLLVALVLHKLPEGFALGGIIGPALRSRAVATLLAIAAEAGTLLGGALSLAFGPKVGSQWTSYPLAIAGGFFVFLAYHALLGEWNTRRTRVKA